MLEIIEFLAWAGGTAVVTVGSAVVLVRRVPAARRDRAPSSFAMARLIGTLPVRHRREARRIVAIAREHDGANLVGQLDGFTARETLRRYLPETIAAYLCVPVELRGRRRGGLPSPDEELADQLHALRAGLEALRDSVADAAVQRMQQNKTFLHDRFGPPPPRERPALSPALAKLNDLLTTFLRGV